MHYLNLDHPKDKEFIIVYCIMIFTKIDVSCYLDLSVQMRLKRAIHVIIIWEGRNTDLFFFCGWVSGVHTELNSHDGSWPFFSVHEGDWGIITSKKFVYRTFTCMWLEPWLGTTEKGIGSEIRRCSIPTQIIFTGTVIVI